MSCNPLHSGQKVEDGIHIPYAFEFTDTAEMNSATVTADDLGKFARVDDDIYMLTATDPTWVLIGGISQFTDLSELYAIVNNILIAIDGYAIDEYDQQVQITSLYVAADGYQNQINTILNAIDGYETIADHDHDLAQQSIWNDTVRAALDGYGTLFLWGNNSITASTTTRYLMPGYSDSTATSTLIQLMAPRSGIMKNMYVVHNGPSGNGNSIQYVLRKNGINSSLTVSLASTSSSGSNTTNTVQISQGDVLDVLVTKATTIANSPSNIVVTMELV